MTTGVAPGQGTIPCPRCGAPVADGQEWCLSCGDAARTRLVPTPNWRIPLAMVGLLATLALIALAVAFVQLTRDDPAAPPAATAPAAAPAPATPAPTTPTEPGTTAPGTPAPKAPGTTAPGATTPTEPSAPTPTQPGQSAPGAPDEP